MMSEMEAATSSPPLLPTPLTAATSATARTRDDKCYHCQEHGHWARDCPNKTPNKSTPSLEYPTIQCPCGNGACVLLRSNTEKNPDRWFYTCPIKGTGKCKFFKWFDKVTQEDIKLSQNLVVPKCPCGAGTCKRLTESTGPNIGRSYFVCPIKKGLGACPFFKWEDTVAYIEDKDQSKDYGSPQGKDQIDDSKDSGSPQSTCDSHKVFDVMNSDFPKKDNLTFEQCGEMELPNSGFMPTSTAQTQLLVRENQEFGKESNISLTNEHDPSSCVAPQHGNFVLNSTKGHLVMRKAVPWDSMVKVSHVCLMSQSDIHCRQMEFWRQISGAGDISIKDIIYQRLGLEVLGWLGRLAFPPPRCLKDRPPSPFYCGIFPAFDRIFVPQDRDMFNPEGVTPLPQCPSDNDKLSPPIPGQDLQPWNVDLQKPSHLKRSSTIMEDGNGPSLLSEILQQAAIHIQNQLIMLLNKADPSDLDYMTKAVHRVFPVFDAMSIDYGAFSGRVMQFIASASRLSGIEQSIENGPSLQECIEACNLKKARFDDISKVHKEAVAVFTSASKRLQSLHEQASRVRDMLNEIENQLMCCKAETSELKTHVDVINRDMLESQISMQKAEEALNLCKQREEERCAAKAALEKIWSMKEVCELRFCKRRKV